MHLLPLLVIPIFVPKLSLFPIFFFLLKAIFEKEKKYILPLIISLFIMAISWKSFNGQTVFIPDYEARQEVIRKTQLYHSVLLARLMQNKVNIVLDKFVSNFFAITDPNNYLFGFAPRPIVGNQNITKIPFLGLPFLLFGIYEMRKYKYKSFLIISSLSAIGSLSVLTIFDRNDLILWVPLSLLFIFGLDVFVNKFKYAKFYLAAYFIFSVFEFIRAFAIFVQ